MTINPTDFSETGRSAKTRIRLLEIVGNAIVGGMESHVGSLVTNLPRDEFEVICLCPYESPFTASLRRLGFDVFIAPVDDDPLWRSIEMAAEIVRQNDVDLIHAHLPNAHTLAGLVGRLTDTPAVATLHSRGLVAQELSVTRLTGTQLIVVCQETYAQALATGVPRRNVTLVPNGVDTERFTPDRNGAGFRDAIGVPSNAPLVGFVGRLSPEKGPDRFLLAAERIHQRRPDIHFAMVGEGPLREELETDLARSGLGGSFHMVETRGDMEAVYPAFDLLLQTSRSEGMPLVLLEAMACGVPVVAVGIGGVAEVIEHGATGSLVSPVDWEELVTEALRLLEAPARLKAMGLVGRQRVEARFDLRECVGATAALFRRLASGAVAAQNVAPATPLRNRRRPNGADGPALKLTRGASA